MRVTLLRWRHHKNRSWFEGAGGSMCICLVHSLISSTSHNVTYIEGTQEIFVEWMNGLKYRKWDLASKARTGRKCGGIKLCGSETKKDWLIDWCWLCHLLEYSRRVGMDWSPLFSRTSPAGLPYFFCGPQAILPLLAPPTIICFHGLLKNSFFSWREENIKIFFDPKEIF